MNILETASKEIGVTAKLGPANNPRVLEYFQKVGHSWVHDDQTAWCAAFVGFILETCGIASTKRLNARSYLSWGVSTKKPKPGDVVVFWRDSVSGPLGHVSFFHHEDENTVFCLGGNQLGEKVSIQGYPKSRVLDYRSAIIANAPQAHPIKDMNETNTAENIVITKETPQVVTVSKIVAHFTVTASSTGKITQEDGWVELPLTDEMLAAVKANVAQDYNITVTK